LAILRSVAAIVAGIALFSLLLLAAMAVGNALLGSEPEWINRSFTTQFVWLIWNIVSMVSAGYVAAVVAPRAPATHAIVMGSIQSVFTLVAMLTVSGNVTPQWLWIAGIIATIPAAWAGSRLRGAR
jgi:hypothetical protein